MRSKIFRYEASEIVELDKIITMLQVLPGDMREYIRLALGNPSPEIRKLELSILEFIRGANKHADTMQKDYIILKGMKEESDEEE